MQLQVSKKYLPIIIAGISGLIAVFLINMYIQERTEEAKKRVLLTQKNLGTVVVAKQDIPSGTTLKESMLAEETVNRAILQPRAATSIDRVVDRIAIVPISKGEQVLLNKVTISGQEGSLSMKVPSGKRAIAVSLDNISSVGGMLQPGDHVDVVGMVPIPTVTAEGKQATQLTTMPLFQDVLVLAVGQEFTSVPSVRKEERTVSPVVTLALSPQEANLIVFVQEQGKLRLILRSPQDTQVQRVAPASWETLFRTAMPEQKPETQELRKPKRSVEIYRGLNKEIKGLE